MRSFRLSDSFKFAPNVIYQVTGNYKCYGMIAVHSRAPSTMYVHVAMLCISDRLSKKQEHKWLFWKSKKRQKSKDGTYRIQNRIFKLVDCYSQRWFFLNRAVSLTPSVIMLHVSSKIELLVHPPNLNMSLLRSNTSLFMKLHRSARQPTTFCRQLPSGNVLKGLICSSKVPNV